MDKQPGWYVDALESNIGVIVQAQRMDGESVEQLADRFLDRRVHSTGDMLGEKDHVEALALCLAICVRRLARVDMPA